MIKQIKYFQSVVRLGSFTAAAEEHFISQSAISQQIRALEEELGVELLDRKKRSFTLTPAGEFFYRKSLVLIADFDTICRETQKAAGQTGELLRVGVLRGYTGDEFMNAAAAFSAAFPDISAEVTHGDHDELYDLLRTGELDIVLNDQRRAFSDEYRNIVLDVTEYCIEISSKSPLAELPSVEISDLKNIPLILCSSEAQRDTETRFFKNDIGFRSDIVFCDTSEDAKMLLIQGKGFMTVEGCGKNVPQGSTTAKIPLTRRGEPVIRRYCAFEKVDNPRKHTEEFLDILKAQY